MKFILTFTSLVIHCIVATAQDTTSFLKLKHSAQTECYDSTLGIKICDSTESKYQILFIPGKWSFDRASQLLSLQGIVLTTYSSSKNGLKDTLPLCYNIFLAERKNEHLVNKRLITSNYEKHDAGIPFSFTVKITPTDRLYISNCFNELLQEWQIESLFRKDYR